MPRWRFTIDETGFAQLLKREIYSRDDVYLRELLQNAFDSSAQQVVLSLLVRPESQDLVWGIRCSDDGYGMTKSSLRDDLLRLCSRTSSTVPKFGRFGIGVFTYLSCAGTIVVVTKAERSQSWMLVVNRPKTLESLASLPVSQPMRATRQERGSSVLLVLDEVQPLSAVVASLRHWIRAELPCTLQVCASPEDP